LAELARMNLELDRLRKREAFRPKEKKNQIYVE